jgi:hypothetical protein
MSKPVIRIEIVYDNGHFYMITPESVWEDNCNGGRFPSQFETEIERLTGAEDGG